MGDGQRWLGVVNTQYSLQRMCCRTETCITLLTIVTPINYKKQNHLILSFCNDLLKYQRHLNSSLPRNSFYTHVPFQSLNSGISDTLTYGGSYTYICINFGIFSCYSVSCLWLLEQSEEPWAQRKVCTFPTMYCMKHGLRTMPLTVYVSL